MDNSPAKSVHSQAAKLNTPAKEFIQIALHNALPSGATFVYPAVTNTLFLCPYQWCNFQVNSSDVMKQHMDKIHTITSPVSKMADQTDSQVVCAVCMQTFPSESEMYTHSDDVHGSRYCSCHTCLSKSATHKLLVMTQVNDGHEEKTIYKCFVCSRGFFTRCKCLDHCRTSHVREPFECGACESNFDNFKDLRRHTREHSNNRMGSQCGYCRIVAKERKMFQNPQTLNAHMNNVHNFAQDLIRWRELKEPDQKKRVSSKFLVDNFNQPASRIASGDTDHSSSICNIPENTPQNNMVGPSTKYVYHEENVCDNSCRTHSSKHSCSVKDDSMKHPAKVKDNTSKHEEMATDNCKKYPEMVKDSCRKSPEMVKDNSDKQSDTVQSSSTKTCNHVTDNSSKKVAPHKKKRGRPPKLQSKKPGGSASQNSKKGRQLETVKDNSSKQSIMMKDHSKEHPQIVEEPSEMVEEQIELSEKQSRTIKGKSKKESKTVKNNGKRRSIRIYDEDSEATQIASSSSGESDVKKTKVCNNSETVKENSKEQFEIVRGNGKRKRNKISDEDSEGTQYSARSGDESNVKMMKVCNDPESVKEKSKKQSKTVKDVGKRNSTSDQDSEVTIIADSSEEESNVKKTKVCDDPEPVKEKQSETVKDTGKRNKISDEDSDATIIADSSSEESNVKEAKCDDSVYDYVVTEDEGGSPRDFNYNSSVANYAQFSSKQHSPKQRNKQKPEPKKRLIYVSKSLAHMATPEKVPITRDETTVTLPPTSLEGNFLNAGSSKSLAEIATPEKTQIARDETRVIVAT